MPTTPFALIPYPASTDADDPPADFQALGEYVDSRVVLRATSASDRDARYLNPPDGTFCVSTSDGTMWLRAGGVWKTVWAPVGDWVNCTLPSTYQGPVQVRSGFVGGKKFAWMRGNLSRVDSTNLTATAAEGGLVATLPAGYIPNSAYGTINISIANSLAGGAQSSASRIAIAPGTGQIQWWGLQDSSQSYVDAGWISFDGVGFWIDF